jgi:hypothetical protein
MFLNRDGYISVMRNGKIVRVTADELRKEGFGRG